MTGPMEAPERLSPRPPRPPLSRPTPTGGPTKRKPQPPVIAAGGMLVVLGFLALTSWVGLLWAGIATGVAAVAGTGAVRAAKKRRNGIRRTGGTGGGLFPGLGRRRTGTGSPRRRTGGLPRNGTPTRRPMTGKKTGLGTGKSTSSGARSKGGLRGRFGKSTTGNASRPTRSAGSSRNPFTRNQARSGVGSTGARAAGQSRFRNPFKGSKGAATSGRSSAPGSGRSRNPLRRATGTATGTSARSAGARMRNPFKRSGTGTGNASRPRVGSLTPRGTAMPGRRSRNPFKRTSGATPKGTTPGRGIAVPRGTATGRPSRNPFKRRGTPGSGTPSTGTGASRRGPFKRSKGGPLMKATTPSSIRIKRGTKPPPPPTRAQIKEGIRVQQARRVADAKKATGRRSVSGWLGRLGQPKPPKPGAPTPGRDRFRKATPVASGAKPRGRFGGWLKSSPAKSAQPAGPATSPPAAPPSRPMASRPAVAQPGRRDARWSVGTGQDEEPGRRRSTPPPAPTPKPATPTPAPTPAQPPKREAPPPAKHNAKTCPDHGASCSVDHEAIRYGHKHDQPGRVPTTGGNKMRHAESGGRQDYDDMGLVAYINAQGGLQEGAAALAQQGEKMLAAADNQPLNPQVRENLQGFVAILKSAAGAGENLVPAARRHHETDFARAEEPRGSRTQEKNADVTKTEADGY